MKKLLLLLTTAALALGANAQKPLATIKSGKNVLPLNNKVEKSAEKVASQTPVRTLAGDVISEQPEGTMVTYNRAGESIYYSSWFGYMTSEQSGKAYVVYADDGETIYMKDPISNAQQDTWVKGTINADGTQITIPLDQCIAWYEGFDSDSDYYNYGIRLAVGSTVIEEEVDTAGEVSYYIDFVPANATEAVFSIGEDSTLTMLNTEGDMYAEFPNNYAATGLALVYDMADDCAPYYLDYDGAWAGYIDWNTVLTVRPPAHPAVPVNPTDLTWKDAGDESGNSRFGFTINLQDTEGGELEPEYVSYSIFTDDDQIFTFDVATYGAANESLTQDMTEIPYGFSDWDFYTSAVYFYRTNTGDNPLFTNRIGIQVYYTVDGVRNASDIVYWEIIPVVAATPADPMNLEWTDSGSEDGFSNLYFDIPADASGNPLDVDGNPMNPDHLTYSIFTDDDVIFTFDTDTYGYDLDEATTEIPYGFSGYDFYSHRVYFYRTNAVGYDTFFKTRIGMRLNYHVGEDVYSSNIVYWYLPTAVDEINTGKTIANVEYYNIAGQKVQQAKGLTIVRITYTDGTTSTRKVVK